MASPTSSSPVGSVLNSGNLSIDALISGSKWGTTTAGPTTVTYSFPWTTNANAVYSGAGGGRYSPDNEASAAQHYGLDATQQAAATGALQAWANVANINPVLVADTSTSVGDIRLGFTSATQSSSDGGQAWGWAYFPTANTPSGGDVWISTSTTSTDWSVGSYNYMSLVHELGHALGLKHPFEDGDVDLAHANREYSIMAYDDAPNSVWVDFSRTSAGYSWKSYNIVPDSPMVNDIAAIQYLYGANTSYNTGNNTYTFDPATPFLHTIWDAGGNDTISIANFTVGSVIDLQAGHYSSLRMVAEQSPAGVVWNTAPPTTTYDGANNLGIAYGVTIENAIGGSGNDTLIGNAVANHLQGNGGANSIDGGDGIDTAVYTGNFSSYALAATSTGYLVTLQSNPSQTDTLTNIERLSFANASMALNMNSLAEDPLQSKYVEMAQKFYVAYFGRPADATGLANMVARFAADNAPTTADGIVAAYKTSDSIRGLVDNFGNSDESAKLYQGTNNHDFVVSIFVHLLGRTPPEGDGLNFWISALDTGSVSRSVLALNIVGGAESNQTAQGKIDAALVANRVTVAANFTALLDQPSEVAGYSGYDAAATARALLDLVNQDTSVISYESTVIGTVAQMASSGVHAEIIGISHASGHSVMMA
jgi:Ca2+-binding RTX toxin-like protein